MRLVNGPNSRSGRVEVYFYDQWGTVCDDSWDNTDANIVCRQLGHSGGTALVDSEYGDGEGEIWLDEVECTGNEYIISSCDSNTWGDNDCWHFEDAGVQCGKSFETDLTEF